MMAIEMLLDMAPAAGVVGIAAGVGFFLVLLAVAYVAFRLLRRTMKTAFRLAIVAVILFVAAVGSITILWFSTSRPSHSRPPVLRKR